MGRHTARPLVAQPGVRTPHFRRLTAAWAVSSVGDGVRLVALPLVAALLTRDPLAVTAVAAAELLPWLLLSLPAGALVDRWDSRRVVILAHLARALITAALVLALLAGAAGVLVLCVAAFTLTVAETFADGASQVLMVELTGDGELVAANARFRSVETLALTIVGPLAGGVLVAVEPALAFALDGASFVLAAALTWSLPKCRSWGVDAADDPATHHPVADRGQVPAGSAVARLLNEVREGVRVLLGTPALRVLVVVTTWTSLATGGVNAVFTLFALEILRLPVQIVPALVVVQALGILLGARVVQPLLGSRGDGQLMLGALVLVGGSYLVIGVLANTVVVFVAYFVAGVGFALWNVLAGARRQRVCPPGLLGRVSNATRTVTWGAMPLGAVLAGLIASVSSTQWVFLVGGVLILLTAVVCRRAVLFSAPDTATARERAPA